EAFGALEIDVPVGRVQRQVPPSFVSVDIRPISEERRGRPDVIAEVAAVREVDGVILLRLIGVNRTVGVYGRESADQRVRIRVPTRTGVSVELVVADRAGLHDPRAQLPAVYIVSR